MNITTLDQKQRGLEILKVSICMILILLFTLYVYTFLHESGHMLVGLLFGGKITSFSIALFKLSAHVGLEGEFEGWQEALISSAGVSFALLMWVIFILLVPRKTNVLLEFLKIVLSMAFINTLLAWIVIPILSMNGQIIGDDSANFLRYTSFPPLLVSAAALHIYLGAWVLFLLRSTGSRNLVTSLRSPDAGRKLYFDLSSPQLRNTLIGILIVGSLVGLAGIGLGSVFGTISQIDIPDGYTLIGSYDLSQASFNDQVVFTLEQKSSTNLSFFFTLTNINRAPTKIRLTGPDGYNNIFFATNNADFKSIGQASVNPQDLLLDPGIYQLRLTFPSEQGMVTFYIKKETN